MLAFLDLFIQLTYLHWMRALITEEKQNRLRELAAKDKVMFVQVGSDAKIIFASGLFNNFFQILWVLSSQQLISFKTDPDFKEASSKTSKDQIKPLNEIPESNSVYQKNRASKMQAFALS